MSATGMQGKEFDYEKFRLRKFANRLIEMGEVEVREEPVAHGRGAQRLEVGSGVVTRLATDGSYADLAPAPDGSTLYALRSGPDRPAHVVRLGDRRSPTARIASERLLARSRPGSRQRSTV